MKKIENNKGANLVFGALNHLFGLYRHELRHGPRERQLADGRKVFIHCIRELTLATHEEIAQMIGLDRTTICNHLVARPQHTYLEDRIKQVIEFVRNQVENKPRIDALESRVAYLEERLADLEKHYSVPIIQKVAQ